MVDNRFNNKVQEEFAPELSEEWFSKSSKKFLHNIKLRGIIDAL